MPAITTIGRKANLTTWRCKEMKWNIHISMGWLYSESATATYGSTSLLTESNTALYNLVALDAEGQGATGFVTVRPRKVSMVVSGGHNA